MNRQFRVNRAQGKLMGVAAGLSDASGADPLLIRLALILALMVTGPVALVLYVAAGLLATDR